jgi:invasion protein IalB
MRPTLAFHVLTGALISASPALGAAKNGLINVFNDWEAHAAASNSDKACYAGSRPSKQEGKYSNRGPAYVLVTHRPKDKAVNVVNVEAGYTYKDGSEVTVAVGSQTFTLFTHGGQAWARDSTTDAALVKAMRAGATMTVTGTSARGTKTTDTYSLKGFSAAHQAIAQACGVK